MDAGRWGKIVKKLFICCDLKKRNFHVENKWIPFYKTIGKEYSVDDEK